MATTSNRQSISGMRRCAKNWRAMRERLRRLSRVTASSGKEFVVVRTKGSQVLMEVFLREVYPAITEQLILRLRAIARAELTTLIASVGSKATESLRSQGYQ